MSKKHVYTEGVMQDGAAILKDGKLMSIPEVLSELNDRQDNISDGYHTFNNAWQPIETAPKYPNTKILCFFPKWDGGKGSICPAVWSKKFGWLTYRSSKDEPTHWMPMPKHPRDFG